MRILTFTTLYPNSIQPQFGVFVENRMRHLVGEGSVEATVIAPVPWFPWRARAFGRYSSTALVPAEEWHFGIRILHPRYPAIPKFGMNAAPFLMYAAIKSAALKLIDTGYTISTSSTRTISLRTGSRRRWWRDGSAGR